MKSLLSQSKEAYVLSWRFLNIAIWLVAIPVGFEALQHIVEYSIGMFQSDDGVQPGSERNLRLLFGAGKVLSVLFVTIAMSRYFLHDNDLKKALKFDRTAIRASFNLLLSSVLALALVHYAPTYFFSWIATLGIDLSEKMIKLSPVLLLVLLAGTMQHNFLKVFASMLGDDNSLSKQAAKYFSHRSLILMTLVTAPSMVLHYKLNYAAIDESFALQISLLAADSVLVGLMSALLGASTWIAYREAKRVSSEHLPALATR